MKSQSTRRSWKNRRILHVKKEIKKEIKSCIVGTEKKFNCNALHCF